VFTRARFLQLVYCAVNVLVSSGVRKNCRTVHFFSGNKVEDLVLRTAAILVGSVPVTINWFTFIDVISYTYRLLILTCNRNHTTLRQADNTDKILFKVQSTDAIIVFVDKDTDVAGIDAIRSKLPSVRILDAATAINSTEAISMADLISFIARNGLPGLESTRCIIFTSGTTGDPKGVELSYSNYRANAATFDSFLLPSDVRAGDQVLVPIVVNPMHHTNSTSITDWALRRAGTRLHLLERYFTGYWKILSSVVLDCSVDEVSSVEPAAAAAVVERRKDSVFVAPLVSRHIDFLESLVQSGSVGLAPDTLKVALNNTVLLLGSAPVGPSTTSRLLRYAGRLPTVRFGSTETTLQVCGIPIQQSSAETMAAFEAGWHHSWSEEPCAGYYIGREHSPHTEVRIVRSVSPADPQYLVDCEEGEPGYVITKGSHVMSKYVGLVEVYAAAISEDGWYLNLGDIGFWLSGISDQSSKNLYWQSRDSHMLIRGGANYAFEQVCMELKILFCNRYDLPESAFSIAVCGLRVKSEHEDECCVLVELHSDEAKIMKDEIERTFLAYSHEKGVVSKGSRPDRFAIRTIPMIISKGIVDVPAMTTYFKNQ